MRKFYLTALLAILLIGYQKCPANGLGAFLSAGYLSMNNKLIIPTNNYEFTNTYYNYGLGLILEAKIEEKEYYLNRFNLGVESLSMADGDKDYGINLWLLNFDMTNGLIVYQKSKIITWAGVQFVGNLFYGEKKSPELVDFGFIYGLGMATGFNYDIDKTYLSFEFGSRYCWIRGNLNNQLDKPNGINNPDLKSEGYSLKFYFKVALLFNFGDDDNPRIKAIERTKRKRPETN